MCVTPYPASISGTRTYVYATSLDAEGAKPVHVCGYQNEAETHGGPNCMFLNFAGKNLALVRGPEYTSSFMRDMTRGLPRLRPPMTLGGDFSRGTFGARSSITVEDYGDYTVILAQGPADILSVLDQVPMNRRPRRTPKLEEMVNFYMSFSPQDTFALPCFDGRVKPKHPITVSYEPRDPGVLTIPGLDGHDGRVPVVGAPVFRDFRVAFAVRGEQLPHAVRYSDSVSDKLWAPASVAGFVDDRFDGPNGDYVVSVADVKAGLTGRELADQLV
jgi:hypothetical protein